MSILPQFKNKRKELEVKLEGEFSTLVLQKRKMKSNKIPLVRDRAEPTTKGPGFQPIVFAHPHWEVSLEFLILLSWLEWSLRVRTQA